MASTTHAENAGHAPVHALRTLLCVGALLASPLATGCTKSENDLAGTDTQAAKAAVQGEQPVAGGAWIVGSIGDASSLLPILATDSASHDIIDLVFCGLLKYGPSYEIVGDLAESYEILDDGLRIRMVLRKNATWYDGAPVTVDDVLFARAVALDPKTPTPYRSKFEQIGEVKKIDSHTVDFIYHQPHAPALNDIVGSAGTVLPKHLLAGQDIVSSPLNREPVGCGPYKFKRWDAKREIELVANESYFAGRPHIDNYLYRIIPDQATMFLELQNRGIDQMGLRPQQYKLQTNSAKFNKSFTKYRYTGFNYSYLGYNQLNPLFQDVRVRRALSYAVDRQEILDGVNYGLGQVATGPYRPGMWYYKVGASEPTFDLDVSKKLLSEAGWVDSDGDGILDKDGTAFKFEIVTNQGNLQRKQVAEIVQAQFKKLGIDVGIRIVEWAAFLEEFIYKKKFEAVILGWSTGIDPDQFDIWHSSRTGAKEFNFISYNNPRVDELLETGRRTVDRDQRATIYGEVQDILAWEQPYTFLFIGDSLPAVQKRVRGIKLADAGIGYNFEQWWIPASSQGFHLKH